MAGSSTTTITFKIDGDVKTFQILAKDAENLKKVLGTTVSETKKLGDKLLDMNQAAEAFRGMETLIRASRAPSARCRRSSTRPARTRLAWRSR